MSTTDNWVGTWRPHLPRGPIAALYGSPGPKYALPTLTGSIQHDLTKHKAPMYSLGARRSRKIEGSPGPGLIPSNITRVGRDGAPAFSFCSRLKEPKLFQAPGPGKYSPENSGKLIFRTAPAYTLSGRTKDISTFQTPGPAQYTLPPVLGLHTVVTPSALAYSIGGRNKSFLDNLKKTPGPAAYEGVNPCIYRQKAPQFSMSGRNFPPSETTMKPGPGAHCPEGVTSTKAQAPSYSFGMRHSKYIVELIVPEETHV
ncbi:ciliary microtubule associated protein 1A-like [Sebastes fasciatus]|uniref:ciliary microtubule associated protein 1A-like n=1 Tax=Sebastes fasciatus TaxID=394691 RepID=UPI003D9EF66F